MVKYHLFCKAGYTLYNYRVHDIYRFLRADSAVECHDQMDLAMVERFLAENHQHDDLCVIFYHHQHTDDYIFRVLEKLAKYPQEEFKLKVLFFTFDYWIRADNPYNKTIRKIFVAKNHYVVSFAENVEQLSTFHGTDYSEFAEKYIFLNIWCAYRTTFVEFNHNPINKVCVSGVVDGYYYPERVQVLTMRGTEQLPIDGLEMRRDGNSYNKRINRYLCCYASSVHGPTIRGDLTNTHIILLKYFEILAVGALLLCPDSELEQLHRLGLYSFKNCIICNMSELQPMIDYILNPRNREEIDQIRRKGQLFAQEHLTSEKKYQELKNALEVKFRHKLQ